ncbi:MAG TPA: hypothetical protein PK156_28900 [Polyangium sp.]|nr:hypothetical protein [Polyangium sp.]
MTTIAPWLQTVKPHHVKSHRAVPRVKVIIDEDPTEYPSGEPIMRDPTESRIASKLEAMLIRYQADRGIVCYVGSDNAIYWVRGDNRQCVSPDVYILPGIAPDAHPKEFVGSKDEGCWKTWIHQVKPSFAVEVKAWTNPRKDELQSPKRHDALGTKELIVFDPFHRRRRAGRKRFVVYRRNQAGKLAIVLETNEDRVFSEQLDAHLVVQGDDEKSLLRVGLGPHGEQLLPFESELVELEAQKASEATLRAEHEARMRQAEAQRADEALQRVQEEARRADDVSRRLDEETRERENQARRVAELEAELARLRARSEERPKTRTSKRK